ncbi:MAG: tetrahydrofolate dehydrogenase/cyclohydrolase catalytic domain-containing protein [Catalinimonas sp.]
MQILDGKATAAAVRREITDAVAERSATGERPPHLAAILVGSNPASEAYVRNKVKDCAAVGFESSLFRFEASVSEAVLLDQIRRVNDDPGIDGLIVQLPLPDHISAVRVTETIDPRKDVDGFHPGNVGRMVLGLPTYLPATPYGIVELLRRYEIDTSGMRAVVVGRSHIVGSPMSVLLARNANPGNATVTLCHSRTRDLPALLREADLIVAALGRPGFIGADQVKEGAVVIDVGITRVADSTKMSGWALRGDVAYDEVAPRCRAITPVPGGVGPMTRAGLLLNTLAAARGEVYG